MAIRNIPDIFSRLQELLPDNDSQQISPDDVRACMQDLAESALNRLSDGLYMGLREYNTARPYEVGECCVLNNKVYKCISATQGTFNSAHWLEQNKINGALAYKGLWNASSNYPAIPSATEDNAGWYYVVAIGGSTNIDGNNDWGAKDWIVSNGTTWDKIDNSEVIYYTDGDGLTLTGTMLSLELDGTTLQKGSNGLKIREMGITDAHIANDALIDLEKLAPLTPQYVVGTDINGSMVSAGLPVANLLHLTNSNSNIQTQLDGKANTTGNIGDLVKLGTVSSHDLQFITQNIIRAVINADGAIGIGTTTPSAFVKADLAGGMAIRAGATVTASGNINDYDPNADGSLLFSGGQTLTGIQKGVNGRILLIVNQSTSTTMTIANNSLSSSTQNRILTGTGANLTINANATCTLWYDIASARWRVIAK